MHTLITLSHQFQTHYLTFMNAYYYNIYIYIYFLKMFVNQIKYSGDLEFKFQLSRKTLKITN